LPDYYEIMKILKVAIGSIDKVIAKIKEFVSFLLDHGVNAVAMCVVFGR